MKKTFIFLLTFMSLSLLQAQDSYNFDFEEWESQGQDTNFIKPVAWAAMARTYTKVNNAFSGDYAVRINSWYLGLSDYLMIGNSFEKPGVPFNATPTTLTGYYKYEQVPGAIPAQVSVFLTKYDVALQKIDTIGIGDLFLAPSDAYIKFSVPIAYSKSILPDTLIILFKTGNVYCGPNTPDCAFLTIDKLELTQTTSVQNTSVEDGIDISPNPTTDILKITSKEASIVSYEIYDLVGKLLYADTVNSNEVSISLSHLPSAPYWIKLSTADQTVFKKVIKK